MVKGTPVCGEHLMPPVVRCEKTLVTRKTSILWYMAAALTMVQPANAVDPQDQLRIEVRDELDFGTVIADGSGRITLLPASRTRTLTNTAALPTDHYRVGELVITGTPNERVLIDLPQQTRGSRGLTLTNFTVYPAEPHFLNGQGELIIAVGAEVVLRQVPSGQHDLPFTVRVSYFWPDTVDPDQN